MRKKLVSGVIVAVLSIGLLVVIGQIILKFYRGQTETLIIEHREISVLQDYKRSLNNLQMQLNFLQYKAGTILNDDIISQYDDSKRKFEKLSKFLTSKHKDAVWNDIAADAKNIDSAFNKIIQSKLSVTGATFREIGLQISRSLANLNHLLDETKEEINETERISIKVIHHGRLTMLGIGLSVILILLIGGIKFVNNLTDPIRNLVNGAESIIAGKKDIRVHIHHENEFKKLADTFNSMLDSLEKTTVNKEYFLSIIDNLYGALFVLSESGIIRTVNKTSVQKFEFTEKELLDIPIYKLFERAESENFKKSLMKTNFQQKMDFLNHQSVMVTKSCKNIPVTINCTRLQGQENDNDEILLVAHDITEKIFLEEKLKQNQNEIRLAIDEAKEKEKIQLARELHDSIGQQITGIYLAVQKLHASKKYSENLIQSVVAQLDATLKETRKISHNLIPIVLIEFGLIAAIQNLITNTNKLGKTMFHFFHYDITERINNKIEKAIYRICQEAINNILKHAEAKNASIQFLKSSDQITITIEDDGVGFNPSILHPSKTNYKDALGLKSIQERVFNLNGKINIESNPGDGTEIMIEIPYDK